MSFADSDGERFRVLADNEVIKITSDGYIGAGTRLFDDPDEYHTAVVEAYGHAEGEEVIIHEMAHYRVAMAVGIVRAQFGLRITDKPNGRRELWSYIDIQEGVFPKLALAAIFAAPTDPSNMDQQDIHDLGYVGISDVGDRIYEWNSNNNGIYIPAPLSYAPGMPGSRFAAQTIHHHKEAMLSGVL